MNSNDGVSQIMNTTDVISQSLSMFGKNSDMDVNGTTDFYNETQYNQEIKCNNSMNICHIVCMESRSCSSVIIDNKGINIDNLYIECIGIASCFQMELNVHSSFIENIDIECGNYDSCKSLNINTTDVILRSFQIRCKESNACIMMGINMNDTILQHLLIHCDSTDSCRYLNFASVTSNITNITNICNAKYSCYSMNVDIYETSNNIINTHCIEDRACKAMRIDVVTNESASTIINCFNGYSCDELYVETNSNVSININMYKYSRNVRVSNTNIDNIDIKCGNDKDHRFIRYNVDQIISNDELLDVARDEYDSNHLPCDGIAIDCSANKLYSKSCQYEYYVDTLNISKILKTESLTSTTCFWMDISDIVTSECTGLCYDKFYNYNISIDFDVVIDNFNVTKDEIIEQCLDFFGSLDATTQTMIEISIIFSNIIQLMYPYKIHQIIDGPDSYLRDPVVELDCTDKSEFHEVHLTLIMSVSSIIDNEDELKLLWSNPLFLEKMEELLSLLFDVPIFVAISYIDQEVAKLFSDEYVYGIIELIYHVHYINFMWLLISTPEKSK